MITLFGSMPAYNTADLSPFVVKVATYLRLAGIDYTHSFGNIRKAPKGKMPWIDDNGEIVADSSFIIEHLKKKHKDLDEGMSEHDRALALSVQRMIEEHSYFCTMYLRWVDPRGWAVQGPVFKKLMVEKAGVPSFLGGFLIERIRGSVGKLMRAQGVGRHSVEEIERMACANLDALSTLLGDNQYFLGDTPRSIDATVWAFMAAVQGFPVDNGVRLHQAKKANVIAYLDRIRTRYWKD